MTHVDEDTGHALYETTQGLLSDAGFEAYEVSNHARGAAARSRHNLAYWRGWDYLGVGPGAHGRLTLDAGRVATATARGSATMSPASRRPASAQSSSATGFPPRMRRRRSGF